MSNSMSAERWKTLEPIIDAAVELAPEQRHEFVRKACSGDVALQAEAEGLLADLVHEDPLLDCVAADRFASLMDGEAGDLPGVLDGRYRIERELGRGGMAIVYLARDLRHDRDVAVKMLHPDLTEALGAERFLAEIRVTAQLHHPHILQLYDSGVAEGVLFYVMPFIDGQSLRERLEREKQLPLADIVRIATEVASALDDAHRQGVIHRDIKPENILLHDFAALVADFGIALALGQASPRITKSGFALGTPQYMSPEQATSAPIDGRSDVYALGTVVYEMLAGEPPFTGSTPQLVLAKRAAMTAPPVRVLRSAAPAAMEAAVARALAREPVDRFATAGEFAEALQRSLDAGVAGDLFAAPGAPRSTRAATRPRLAIAGSVVAAAAALGIGWTLLQRDAESAHPGRVTAALQQLGILSPPLDTLAYVVVADEGSDAAGPEIAESLRNAFKQWRDLQVADGPAIATAAARRPKGAPPEREARRIATALGAGRYLRLSLARFTGRDSLDVSADLFETRSGARLAGARVRIASAQAVPDASMESLANAMLFRDAVPHVARSDGTARTALLAAREAYLRGHLALEDGNFARADSEFLNAVRIDPKYAPALVWLANTRSWTGSKPSWDQFPDQAAQAVAERGQLAPADSMLLAALRALASSRAEDACRLWSRLTEREPYDFAAWYALGNCLRRDVVVVRDPTRPTQWRFRSSYEGAVRAYEQSFRLRPSVLHGFAGRSLANLQGILFTSSASGRFGRAAPPDTQSFIGVPVWQHDSLALFPVAFGARALAPLSDAVAVALQHQRDRFHAIARLWRTEFPQSSDAAEAIAVALEMLGDGASLDTLRLARTLARDPGDRLRIAAAEVFFQVKFSLPSNLAGLRKARALADSLLGADPPSDHREPQLLGSLAALTGRAGLAAAYATAGGVSGAPPPIAQSGPALIAFAALGGPADSLQSLEQQVESGVRSLPESERGLVRNRWLVRAASLAFPDYQLHALTEARTLTTFPQATVVAAAAAGDSAVVRHGLAQLAVARRSMRPADVMIDGIFPESAALFAIGDVREAVAWLDPTLRAVRFSASQDLATVARAGTLVRAMALRAELAARLDDSLTARRWAGAVAVLWSRADAFLGPSVRRMEALAR